MHDIQALVQDLERALLSLNRNEAIKIIHQASTQSSPIEAACEVVTEALDHIGAGWEEGRYSLSQVYISGLICEEAVDAVLPREAPERKDQPKMAIGVFADYHLLGKRIIYSSLRAAGFELTDLGSGLNTEDVVKMVHKQQISVLLLSTLMLPSALKIKELTRQLKDMPVKVVVGGAPFRFDENLWKEVGAYATGKTPKEALEIVNNLTGGKV
ncbi:MAG: cobalamin-dependent protein [Bacteroidetes bacterium]|nr:cobalamin-dependent protein [Bacteroidota bacterium]